MLKTKKPNNLKKMGDLNIQKYIYIFLQLNGNVIKMLSEHIFVSYSLITFPSAVALKSHLSCLSKMQRHNQET